MNDLTRFLLYADNPVAQQLLIMQLERHKLVVTATSNGEEAVKGSFSPIYLTAFLRQCFATAEWESHDPGYYSIALFDHREYLY